MSGRDLPLDAARFPRVSPEAGHYESWYLKARSADLDDPRALWLRHTVHQRPGEPATASLWLTLFDGDEVRAGKRTWPADERLSTPTGALVAVGDARLERDRAIGALRSPGLSTDWDLAIAGDEREQPHLPYAWMYGAPLPRTKSATIRPATSLTGTIGGWDVDRWVGMVGHNWGAEHADRWVWLHAGQFADREGTATWLDGTMGRIVVAGRTTPWIANAVLGLDGERHRLGGLDRMRQTRVEADALRCRFVLRGDAGLRVEGELRSRRERTAVWRYADPKGPQHLSCHSSLADLDLSVRRPGHPDLVLRSPAGATLESGIHPGEELGLPVLPYADGEIG